jgi:hypothetical protein
VPAALLAAAAVALAVPAVAPAATVTGGGLDWTLANVYESGGPRTYLGYVTSPAGSGPSANGTATPSAGATGPTVTPASPRGVDQLATFAFGTASGRYDRAAGTGEIEVKGVVTFSSPIHRFTTSIEHPRIVLTGTTGTLSASGATGVTGQGGTYDRAKPVFALDLSRATVADQGATRTIAGIVPSIANDPFGGYAPGSGPDRTPNTFGSFALRLTLAEDPPPPPAATTGKVRGPARAARVVVTLGDALGKAGKAYAVRLVAGGKTVASGTLEDRTLTLRVRKGKRQYPLIAGRYSLRGTGLATTRVTVAGR